MWHTPNGVRRLCGAEAQLIRASIGFMVEMLECEAKGLSAPWNFGVPAFDDLTWQQRLVLLADMGGALLREEIPPPELTVLSEATVGAIYENLRYRIRSEVENDDPVITEGCDTTNWRRLVLAAIDEIDNPEVLSKQDYQQPNVDCSDLEEWDFTVEILANCVLWDDDWRNEDLFMDVAPEVGRVPKRLLGISDDYYTAIPPDPNDTELDAVRARLRELMTT